MKKYIKPQLESLIFATSYNLLNYNSKNNGQQASEGPGNQGDNANKVPLRGLYV